MGWNNWFTAKVSTTGELDAIFVNLIQKKNAAYIEVMIPTEES